MSVGQVDRQRGTTGFERPQAATAIVAEVLQDSAPPTAPAYVAWLGMVSLLFGPALAALNWFFVTPGIKTLERLGAGPGSTTTLWVVVWAFAGIGLVCFAAGVGLLFGQRWGRWLSFVFVAAAFVGLLIAGGATRVAQNLAELELAERASVGMGGTTYVRFVAAVPAFAPIYGLVLLIVLNLRKARDWAHGRGVVARHPQQPNGRNPADIAPRQELSILALMSLVVSLIPFLLLTQLAALVMGIVALRRIKRSQGRLTGRGFAMAGVSISSLILIGIGSIVGLGLGFYLLSDSPLRLGKSPELVEVRRFAGTDDAAAEPDSTEPRSLLFDGDILLSADRKNGVRAWNAATGEPVCQFMPAGKTTALTPSGAEIVALERGDTLTAVWYQTRTGTEIRRQPFDCEFPPQGVALSRGEPQLAGGFTGESVYVWSLDTGELVASFDVPRRSDGEPDEFRTLAISPDGSHVLLAGQDTIYLCETADGTIRRRFFAEYSGYTTLLFARDGQFALAGKGWGGPVRVLDLQTGDIRSCNDHRWGAACLDLTPDGSLAVSGGRSPSDAGYFVINGQDPDYGREIIVWDPRTCSQIATSYVLKDTVTAVAISPDGRYVAAADSSGQVVLFQLQR